MVGSSCASLCSSNLERCGHEPSPSRSSTGVVLPANRGTRLERPHRYRTTGLRMGNLSEGTSAEYGMAWVLLMNVCKICGMPVFEGTGFGDTHIDIRAHCIEMLKRVPEILGAVEAFAAIGLSLARYCTFCKLPLLASDAGISQLNNHNDLYRCVERLKSAPSDLKLLGREDSDADYIRRLSAERDALAKERSEARNELYVLTAPQMWEVIAQLDDPNSAVVKFKGKNPPWKPSSGDEPSQEP